MHENLSLKQIQKEWHGSYKAYVIGFCLSLFLTSFSFVIVSAKLLSGYAIHIALASLALVQAAAQLIFFLHVGQEAKPKWELLLFYFMFLLLLIVALGTLWIMYDLDVRTMSGMMGEAK